MSNVIVMEELETGLLASTSALSTSYHLERGSTARGCKINLRRIFAHPPIAVPLSPTTRINFATQQASDVRQTKQIFPINAGAFIHQNSIRICQEEGGFRLSLAFMIDCAEPTLIKLMAEGKRKPLGAAIVNTPCIGEMVSISFELRGRKQQQKPQDYQIRTEPLEGLVSGDPIVKTPIRLTQLKETGQYSLKLQEQRLCFQGKEYEILDIYGQSSNTTTEGIMMRDVAGNSCVSVSLTSKPREDDRLDCVICLCEPRDTLFMPCRHLCICSGCAESFARGDGKCPLCRQSFESMMSIIDERGRDSRAESIENMASTGLK